MKLFKSSYKSLNIIQFGDFNFSFLGTDMAKGLAGVLRAPPAVLLLGLTEAWQRIIVLRFFRYCRAVGLVFPPLQKDRWLQKIFSVMSVLTKVAWTSPSLSRWNFDWQYILNESTIAWRSSLHSADIIHRFFSRGAMVLSDFN